jgi:hypothetical protein
VVKKGDLRLKEILSGLSGVLNKDAKNMISMFAMVLVPMGLMYSVIYLPQMLTKEINKPEQCWDIKSVEGKAFKLNLCTGETFPLETSVLKESFSEIQETTNKSSKKDAQTARASS